jgi:hypothetical protein
MALPNDKRSLQDRLSRIATRMAQKFGNGLFTGVTLGAGASAGIPVSVLVNRVGGKKIVLDNLGREDASALSFTIINTALGTTAATQDQLIVQTYIPSALPTGIYGSPAALVMLAKVKSRLDSVDIHVVGDSNADINSWCFGLNRGLIRGCCAPMYGTPLFPVVIHPSAYGLYVTLAGVNPDPSKNAGAVSGNGYRYINASLFDGATSDGSSQFPNSGASLQSGNLYAPNDLKVYFDIKNTSIRMAGGYTSDFAWLPNTGLTFYRGSESPTATALSDCKGNFDTDGIDTRGALTYRVVHSLSPNSTGTFPLFLYGVSANGGAAYNTTFGFSFPVGSIGNPTSYTQMGKRIVVAGATGTTASFQTWAADPNRLGVTIGFNWYGLGSAYGGTTFSKGPFAVYLESVHGNTLGFAVTGMQSYGGASTTLVSTVIDAISTANDSTGNSLLTTVVKETRERQIQAGGSGNVIVFVNSGINEATTSGSGEAAGALAYKQSIAKIVNAYKTVWDNLGYPENDLAFIVTVSHPIFLTPAQEVGTGLYDWNLDGIRSKGVEYAQTAYDANTLSPYSNVTFVNLTMLGTNGITQGGLTTGNSFNSNNNFYRIDGELGVHMVNGFTGGYSYLAELLVNRCLRYQSSY